MNKAPKNKHLLPTHLPFSGPQQQWLNGYLSGLQAASMALTKQMNVSKTTLKPLLILFGSQTGNAADLANDCSQLAKQFAMQGIIKGMDDIEIAELLNYERILIITSTYGEGEMPDNAENLWQAMNAQSDLDLSKIHYAVLALGDSSYEYFCWAGKKWDEKFSALGAHRIFDRVNCDIDFEEKSQQWMLETLAKITEKGSQIAQSSTQQSDEVSKKNVHNRRNPMMAKLKRKKILSGAQSSKQIVHYEIDFSGINESYEAGDVLNIIPHNRQDLIDELLQLLGAKHNENVSWKGDNYQLGDLFKEKLEIRMPSRDFFDALMLRCENNDLHQCFNQNDNKELDEFLYGKDIIDFLKAYPNVVFEAQDLVDLLKPLTPRAYSISSSLTKHPQEVHVTIGSVRYTLDGRSHQGVTSTWLADVIEEGDAIACYFSQNKHFSIPERKDAKMIMIGPGTGIAPFRAFLEAREMRGDQGDNWLFFGDRTRQDDFIYEQQILEWQKTGLLSRLDLAFSRDQHEKIYVQDKMRAAGESLFQWLEEGSYLFVCGDALKMAKDVDKALTDIVLKHGKMNEVQAQEYIANLKKEKRYVRDVY